MCHLYLHKCCCTSQVLHNFKNLEFRACAQRGYPVIFSLRKGATQTARSSSGLGRRPLKAEITSSNLVRATKNFKGSYGSPSSYQFKVGERSWIAADFRSKKVFQKSACVCDGRTVIYFLARSGHADAQRMHSLGCRLMAGQRILVPSMGVRLPPSQPFVRYMARSSSGLGRRPLKAEITSSNLVRATKNFKGSFGSPFA